LCSPFSRSRGHSRSRVACARSRPLAGTSGGWPPPASSSARIDDLVAADARLAADDAALSARIETSVRYVGLHRFDALPGDVGEQSFAVALLDEHATGFVLTSMYGRGAYRLYAKPVMDGRSELVLTEEEALAAKRALDGTGMQVTGQERARRAGS
jgi:hypothetical protein